MTLEQEADQQFHQTHLKMKELSIAIESVDREFNQILSDLGLTKDQVTSYIENKNNFSHPIWEKLQAEKKQLDEKLTLDLSHTKDPLNLKKKFAETGSIQSHWIFVR